MALFDNINSRYTKSMEHGGSYERDAAIGGYDRKELRGLSKQARSGTLTQRERARYKYLKDERGGRRKRGLLSGLGGVAATLGGLAAAGKLGGGDIMEAIKARLAEGKRKKALAKEPSDNIDDPEQEIFEVDPSDLKQEENVEGAYDEGESSNMQLPDGLPFQERSEGGPPVRGGIAPSTPGPEGRSYTPSNHVEQAIEQQLELAREQSSMVSSENPNTGPRRRDVEFAPANRVTEPLTGNEERRSRGGPPLTFGDEDYGDVLTAKGFGSSEIDIDPEGLADPQYEGSAEKMLEVLNNSRQELGLEPVERLSEEVMKETEHARNLNTHQSSRGENFSPLLRGALQTPQTGPRTMSTTAQILNRYN